MKLVKLEDVCYSGSSNISQKDVMILDGSYPIYGASGFIKNINFYKSEKPYIAIVKDGSGVGRTMILPEKSSVIGTMQYIFPRDNIDIRYLYYAITSMDLSKYCTGIAIPHIYFKDYKKEKLNLPSISEQVNIANKLDLMQKIIDLKQQQIENLEELIKSQFVEMFGDPFDSSKWKLKKLGEVVESIYDGTNIPPKYYQTEGKVLFLRIQNVWRNEFRLEDSVYVSEETNKRYIDTSLKKGDLLITKIGRYFTKESSLGRVAIYLGEDNKANYSNNIMKIRVKDEINSEFLNILLNLDDYQKYIRRVSKGGTDKRALSKSVIEKFPIINPPIELQKQFIEIVRQINKQKVILKKSLKEIKELQESLMNRYFG